MSFNNPSGFFDKVIETLLEPYQSWNIFLLSISGLLDAFTDLQSKTAWLYILSGIAISGVIYVIHKKRGLLDRTSSFREFLCPNEIYRAPSAILDYKFVAIDLTIRTLVYIPFIGGVSQLCYELTLMVRHAVPVTSLPIAVPAFPLVATLGMIVITDFGFFIGHYLSHKIPLFWLFHQVHHSAEVLTPITVYRNHPVDALLIMPLTSIVTALGAILFTMHSESPVQPVTIFGVNVFLFAFYQCAFQLRHSHIWLSYGPVLSRIFISPAQHQIHHSKDPKHCDKNFGFVFAIWDVLFRSCYVPQSRESLRFGIHGVDHRDFASVSKLYFLPFTKAWHYLVGIRATSAAPLPTIEPEK